MLAALDAAHPPVVTAHRASRRAAPSAIGFPSYQALLPDLVPREELASAIALGSAQWNLGRVIGPALAGIVIGLGSFEWAFAVNTLSFLAVILAIAPLRLPPPIAERARVDPGGDRARDCALVAENPGSALSWPYLAPELAARGAVHRARARRRAQGVRRREHAAPPLLVTAQGIGAVLMALMLGGSPHASAFDVVLLGGLVALAARRSWRTRSRRRWSSVAVAIFFVGAAYLGCLSGFNTVAQLRAPPALRGRVMSVQHDDLLGTIYPIGSVVQGCDRRPDRPARHHRGHRGASSA